MLRRGAGRAGWAAGVLVGAAAVASAQEARVQQYLGLARATQAQPITPMELELALLSPDGVEDIARLFERSLAESVTVAGARVTPELGGEATLEVSSEGGEVTWERTTRMR